MERADILVKLEDREFESQFRERCLAQLMCPEDGEDLKPLQNGLYICPDCTNIYTIYKEEWG